jgi:hypothetical protein
MKALLEEKIDRELCENFVTAIDNHVRDLLDVEMARLQRIINEGETLLQRTIEEGENKSALLQRTIEEGEILIARSRLFTIPPFKTLISWSESNEHSCSARAQNLQRSFC